jgi:predicted transcriptional regulator
MKKHLAIMDKRTIEAILSGKKTVETRFSKAKIAPFALISKGDLVYLKPPGEEVIGQFRVKKVFFFEGLEEKDFYEIFDKYGKQIGTGNNKEDDKYKEDRKNSNYGSLIFISDCERFITSPIQIKKSDQRGWMVL